MDESLIGNILGGLINRDGDNNNCMGNGGWWIILLFILLASGNWGNQYGNGNAYALIEVPVEKLYNIPCVVLNVGMWDINPILGCRAITLEHLQSCFNADQIREGDAILVGTGWSRYWFHPDYLKYSPYFTKEAMEWLLSKKPCLIGSDTARWDHLEHPQNHFGAFYEAGILMAAGFVDLEQCTAPRCKLTILPPKFAITSVAPARAIIIEETDD